MDEASSVLEQYEDHSGIPKAVVRAVLSRLLGWRYDGSPAARRRAVEQLPLVGLRPVEAGARPAVSPVERPPRGC
jgi:hypothetical protein